MGNTKIQLLTFITLAFPFLCNSQTAEINLGKNEIRLNDYFTISLHFPKERKKDFHNFAYYGFPEIEDLLKDRTEYIQDKDKNLIITQYYLSTKPGEYLLHPFTFLINGKTVSSKGTTIHVISKTKRDSSLVLSKKTDKEYKDTKINSYLKLSVTKESVYTGQGFMASLYLYTAISNKTEMTFINLDEQFADLLKRMKPLNCWAEELDLAGAQTDTIAVGAEKYKRWRLYSAMLYPIDTMPITFPVLNLDVVKYAVAEDASQTTVFRKPELYTFHTNATSITVKPLPPHPLRDKVPVGEFRLKEKAEPTHLKAGKSCNYQLNISGEGNINAILTPMLNESPNLEFYTPEVKQVVYRKKYPIEGIKEFEYYIVPEEPGTYQLSDYLYFIYFDPVRKRYDTLLPKTELVVEGESQKNTFISSNSADPFYRNIDKESNELKDYEEDRYIKFFANIIILFMLVTTVFILLRK